ncbi:MAG: VOC family protein [Candidatus Dormiibacterota bacterium]
MWFEVMGKDGKALRRFYRDLFDWDILEAEPSSGFDYGMVNGRDGGVGGGIGTSPDGGSGFATFYVEVDDLTAALARAEKLGGSTIMPPTEIPGMELRFAYISDPEGHVIGLSKGMAQTSGQ